MNLLLHLLYLLSSNVWTTADCVTQVGHGSYATTLPEGKEGPQKQIYKTSNIKGPVPTNDWWSSVAWIQYSEAMFPFPLSVQAVATGLQIGYPNIVGEPKVIKGSHVSDLVLGSTVDNFADTRLDDFTDWTVTMLWDNNAGSRIRTTVGHGLPFVYATTEGGQFKVSFPSTPTIWFGNGTTAALGVTVNGHHYAIFAPPGSTWDGIGTTSLVSDGKGGNFISVAVLPDNDQSTIVYFSKYAYSFVTDTKVSWYYDVTNSQVTTTYTVETNPKVKRAASGTVLALLPHQWKNANNLPFLKYTYKTNRGTLKTIAGSSFKTTMKFHGVLPTLPVAGEYDKSALNNYINDVKNEKSHYVNGNRDTYWTGKFIQRIAVLLPIAKDAGADDAEKELRSWLKEELQSYFSATDSSGREKKDDLFYYDSNWGTMIGYPSSFGASTVLNDHHFHYAYWIRAAAEIASYDKKWAKQWGGIVNLLIRDIAAWKRDDRLFPFLRNFDIYEGHSWASGNAVFWDGNNQESSSEALNAWAALIIWGLATENSVIRDLGVYLFTTEVAAVQQYWFNVDNDNFAPGYNHDYAALLWGGKLDFATWFTANPQQIRGINMLPISGSSLYLGYRPDVIDKNLNQLKSEMGGSNRWTVWQDILWQYQSLSDARTAVELFNEQKDYKPEEGESKAHTYSMLYSMKYLGRINLNVSADTTLYAVFGNGDDTKYVISNSCSYPITVSFSDSTVLKADPLTTKIYCKRKC